MTDELISFELPVDSNSIIKVIGVGGGGSNAVSYMHRQGIKDVDFVVCNTDGQALSDSKVEYKIQLGQSLTQGLGAGNKPEIGRQAAIESMDEITNIIGDHTKMVFITAGMGGGTGTGGAPVIAKAAKEMGLLTVGIVTIPFRFEGERRINQAIEGINELEKYVDSLLVIHNEKLREICHDMKFSEAFSYADNILATAAKGIAEIITVTGYINVDFADVETVMANSGVALMGTGIAEGDERAVKAVQQALTSPLLNDNDITGTDNILLNIRSGSNEITMDEIGEIADYVNSEVGSSPNIIWGTGRDEELGEKVSITIIATGFESNSIPELYAQKSAKKKKVPLRENSGDTTPSEIYTLEDNDEDASVNFTQRTIDFNIKKKRENKHFKLQNDFEDENEYTSEEKDDEIKRRLQESRERMKERKFTGSAMQNNIDEMEQEPAFKRKNIKIDEPVHSKDSEVSRFSLEDDEDEKGTHLRENNSYLYDNVD